MDRITKIKNDLELVTNHSSGYETSSEIFLYSLHIVCGQVWWCHVKQFLISFKTYICKLCKPIDDIINYCTSISGFPTGAEKIGGGGGLCQNMGRALEAVKKYLWRSSFDSKLAGYKPASLQICKNELLHTYFQGFS